jgi:hypothetical protein
MEEDTRRRREDHERRTTRRGDNEKDHGVETERPVNQITKQKSNKSPQTMELGQCRWRKTRWSGIQLLLF